MKVLIGRIYHANGSMLDHGTNQKYSPVYNSEKENDSIRIKKLELKYHGTFKPVTHTPNVSKNIHTTHVDTNNNVSKEKEQITINHDHQNKPYNVHFRGDRYTHTGKVGESQGNTESKGGTPKGTTMHEMQHYDSGKRIWVSTNGTHLEQD